MVADLVTAAQPGTEHEELLGSAVAEALDEPQHTQRRPFAVGCGGRGIHGHVVWSLATASRLGLERKEMGSDGAAERKDVMSHIAPDGARVGRGTSRS